MLVNTIRYFLASFLGRIFPKLPIRTRHGFNIYGNSRDMVGRMLFTFGTWEPNLTQLIVDRVGPRSLFIDVGANLGYFSCLAAKQGARVVGIEAAPDMASIAATNLEGVKPDGRIINAIVAAEEGEMALYESPFSTNLGMRSTVPNDLPVYAIVRSAPLSSLVELTDAENLFIKIDIEGAERPAMLELLERIQARGLPPTTIVVELSEKNQDLIDHFSQAGCRISFLRNNYSREAYESFDGTYVLVPASCSERPPAPFETVIETQPE